MDSIPFDFLDTTSCEAEPIRFPGAVQPHGALFVVDPVSSRIEAASESAEELLGVAATELLGQSLASALRVASQEPRPQRLECRNFLHHEPRSLAYGPDIRLF